MKQADIEKIIATLEKGLESINELNEDTSYYAAHRQVGRAQSVITTAIKQLKGEYPVF